MLSGRSRSAEVDQRFDDPILFGLHHAERPLDLLETELVGGHRGGVDLSGFVGEILIETNRGQTGTPPVWVQYRP